MGHEQNNSDTERNGGRSEGRFTRAQNPMEAFHKKEMLEPENTVDPSGEIRIAQDSFKVWIAKGHSCVESSPCVHVLWRSTVNQMVSDSRGNVSVEDARHLCCRTLSHLLESESLGSKDLAQLLLYWITERQVPPDLQNRLYNDTLENVAHRGNNASDWLYTPG